MSSSTLSPSSNSPEADLTNATSLSEPHFKARDRDQSNKRKRNFPASSQPVKKAKTAVGRMSKDVKIIERVETVEESSPRKRSGPRKKGVIITSAARDEIIVDISEDCAEPEATSKKSKHQAKVKSTVRANNKDDFEGQVEEDEDDSKVKKQVRRKRKTKKEKESEKMPLASRTVASKIAIGAHVSMAGGVQHSVINSLHIGGNAFALFLKSQRKWANPDLKKEDADAFISNCKLHNYDANKYVVPHGSYLVNLAHADSDRSLQAYTSFLDDLKRCHTLGIKLYNFHPGNCASSSREEGIKQLAHNLNRAHKDPDTGNVVTLLETMAPAGNTIGSTFTEIASVIALVKDKSRVGVCLDTCHVFAAGYDLRTPEAFNATIDRFDNEIGLKYLRALHVNDSKAPLGSHKDLHANIGTGFLGLRSFHNLMNEPRLWGLPMVLETPIDRKDEKGKVVQDHSIYAREIKLLESLVGMDLESEEFLELEKQLHSEGEAERMRIQGQVDRKKDKDAKKARKGTGGKKAKKTQEDSASDSELEGE